MVWRAILVLSLLLDFAVLAETPKEVVGSIEAALRSRDYQQALKLSRKALQTSPTDVRVGTMEAMALSALGKRQDALAQFTYVLKISPGYLPALEGAAEIEYQLGSIRAATHLKEILRQRPDDPTAHAMLAVLAYKKRDYKNAAEHFHASGAVLSSQPKALAEYGECLVELGQPADAVPLFQKLAQLRPDDHGVQYDLALAEFLAGRVEETLATLKPLLEDNRPDPDVLDLASSAYEAEGLTPRATDLLHQAIVLAPTNAKYYVDFASLCLAHSSYQVGVDMLNAGVAYVPKSAPLYLARGILRIQAGQYEQGEADFEMADRLNPAQAFSSEAIGITELQQSNLDEGLKSVRLRLRKHQDDAFLHSLLAEILLQKGAQNGSPEFKEAIDQALMAIKLNPNMAVARDILGGLYLKSGQLPLAITQCRLALKSDPDDQNALYHLIQGLRKSGKSTETPELLKRLATLRTAARETEASQNRYKLIELKENQADREVPSP
jgi:tetratricopeptide (TPR) repeat protein